VTFQAVRSRVTGGASGRRRDGRGRVAFGVVRPVGRRSTPPHDGTRPASGTGGGKLRRYPRRRRMAGQAALARVAGAAGLGCALCGCAVARQERGIVVARRRP